MDQREQDALTSMLANCGLAVLAMEPLMERGSRCCLLGVACDMVSEWSLPLLRKFLTLSFFNPVVSRLKSSTRTAWSTNTLEKAGQK
jgi:hypothetical protein